MFKFSYKARGLMSIFGSFMIALSFGTFYTTGGINPYVSSYLRLKVQPWFNSSYIVLMNGYFLLGEGVLMALGGYLAPRIGTKPVLIIGGVIYVSLSAVSSLTLKSGYTMFLLSYAFLSWVGAGISSSLIMGEIMKWFPVWGGTSSAFVNAGFGFGGFILTAFETYLINPENLLPDTSGPYEGYFTDDVLLERVPEMFWKTAILLGGLQVIGIMMVFEPPQGNENELSKIETVSDSVHGSRTTFQLETPDSVQNTGLHPKEVLKTAEFYLIWVVCACQMVPVMFFITSYKSYGLSFIDDDRFLSLIGSIGAAISCIGKVGSGLVSDKLSYNYGLGIVSLGLSVFVQCLYFAQLFETGSKIFFSAFLFLGYIMVGSCYGILPSVTRQAFGLKHAGFNFGMTFSSQALGSFLGSYLVQVIVDKLHWKWSFTCCISFTIFKHL